MAELADAYDSGSYVRKDMQVQFLLPAPKRRKFHTYVVFIVYLAYIKLHRRLWGHLDKDIYKKQVS